MNDLEYSIALNFYEAFTPLIVIQQDPLNDEICSVQHFQIGLN